jgi:hypothetical protein
MRRPMTGVFVSAASIGAVVAGLAVLDGRLRQQIVAVASGRGPSGEIVAVGAQMHDLIKTFLDVARDQSLAHAPLALFAIAAFVLLLFMLRT